MAHPFVPFGLPHLIVIALSVAVPLFLSLIVRHDRHGRIDPLVRAALALLLLSGWLGWLGMGWHAGWLGVKNGLPLNLCDWADGALILALLTRRQFAYELGYFWGLGGTLQGLLTPALYAGWPAPQFLFFFIQHGGVIAALLYLTLGAGLRPTWASLPRVAAASLFYVGVAGLADWYLGSNYGFLRAKPGGTNLLGVMSPWPWYIPELVGTGVAFLLLYYAPFAVLDRLRRIPHMGPRNTRAVGQKT